MSTEYGFKRIGDVELIEAATESANVIIEDAGVLKKLAAKSIGAVKTVNGFAPDADGNVTMEISTVSSWDDLENKPFYDSGKEVEVPVFENSNIAFVESSNEDESGTMYLSSEQDMSSIKLTVGSTYRVTIDDKTYESECKDLSGFPYIGNLNILVSMYTDTGESFLVVPAENLFALNIAGETHSISIKEIAMAVEKELVPANGYTFTCMDEDMLPALMSVGSFDFSSLSDGNLLNVTFDGTEYTNTATIVPGEDLLVFGNLGLAGIGDYTGEPYYGMYSYGMSGMFAVTPSVNKTFSIDKILADSSYESVVPASTYDYAWSIEYPVHALMLTEPNFILEENTSYRVIWEGTEYVCQSFISDEVVCIGNVQNGQSSEPFLFSYREDLGGIESMIVYTSDHTETHQIQISAYVSGVKKLDKKYLPDHKHELPVASYSEAGVVKVGLVTGEDYDLSSDPTYARSVLSEYDGKLYMQRPTMANLRIGIGTGFTAKVLGEYKGVSDTYISIPKIASVADAAGETVTAAEFNALLAALRNAGYM